MKPVDWEISGKCNDPETKNIICFSIFDPIVPLTSKCLLTFIFNLSRKIRELELAEDPSAPLSMAGYDHRGQVGVAVAVSGSSAKMIIG